MGKELTEETLVPITCGECGHTVKRPIKWLRSNTSLKCEGERCESDIAIKFDKDAVDTADAPQSTRLG